MRSERLLVVVAKVILATTVFLEGCQSNYVTTRGEAAMSLMDRIHPLVHDNMMKMSFPKKQESYPWLDSMVVRLKTNTSPRTTAYSSHELTSVESVHLY